MGSHRQLSSALEKEIKDIGFAVEHPDLCLDLGSEKLVYDGRRVVDQGEFCVVHSKAGTDGRWLWSFLTELRVFEAVQGADLNGGHPHIIRLEALIRPDSNNLFGPCMVLEKVEPLGYDMFTVHQQYQLAQRIIPLSQLMRYVRHVCAGISFLHSRGWIHCDLKVDNVLIDKDHNAKVIDFGLSRRSSVDDLPEVRSLYMPPEFGPDSPKASPSADAWLLGGLIQHFYSHNYLQPHWVDSASQDPEGVSQFLRRKGRLKDDVAGKHISTALNGLLRYRPKDRWGFSQAIEWTDEFFRRTSDQEDLQLSIPQGKEQGGKLFGKAAKLIHPVKIFGLCVCGQSETTKSMIGQTLGSLGLGKEGLTVLFIERSNKPDTMRTCEPGGFWQCIISKFSGTLDNPRTVVNSPCVNTKIFLGDWIYLQVRIDGEYSRQITPGGCSRCGTIEHEARTAGIEIFLEFDEFKFPNHCVGMTVGGRGPDSLNLRADFKLNLAFIGRPAKRGGYDPIDITADTVIEPGDHGLICRVPDRDTGVCKSIVSDEMLRPLLDEASFRRVRQGAEHTAGE